MLYTLYSDYFKNIATTHPLLHHQDVEGAQAFTAINVAELIGDFRTKITHQGYVLFAIRPTITRHSATSDTLEVAAGIAVIGYYPKDDSTAKLTTEDTCLRTILQIIERMRQDTEVGYPLFTYTPIANVVINPYENKTIPQYTGVVAFFDLHIPLSICNSDTGWLDAATNNNLTPWP